MALLSRRGQGGVAARGGLRSWLKPLPRLCWKPFEPTNSDRVYWDPSERLRPEGQPIRLLGLLGSDNLAPLPPLWGIDPLMVEVRASLHQHFHCLKSAWRVTGEGPGAAPPPKGPKPKSPTKMAPRSPAPKQAFWDTGSKTPTALPKGSAKNMDSARWQGRRGEPKALKGALVGGLGPTPPPRAPLLGRASCHVATSSVSS